MKTGSFKTYKGPGRISIARYAPRGTPAGYRQCKDFAPGEWFNSVPKAEYERRFDTEILGHLDPQKAWDMLHAMAGGAEPVLLCWETPPFSAKNWCHRRMVARYFERHLGVLVPELQFDPRTKEPIFGDYAKVPGLPEQTTLL